MIKNYFNITLRNLLKNKGLTFINVTGLGVGFASFFLILLIVQYEESFDDFHANKNEIYRIVRIGRATENREYRAGVPFPITRAIRTDIPLVNKAGGIYGETDIQVLIPAENESDAKKFKEKNVLVAEPEFFSMFDFPLAQGSASNALKDINTVLLTKSIATKYFGSWQSAQGKSIKIYDRLMKVDGILHDPPANTDFPLGIVVSYATLMEEGAADDWGSISDDNYCFVQVPKNVTKTQLDKQLNLFTEKRIKPVNPNYFLSAEPLNEIHFDKRFGNLKYRTFSKDLILALSIIGVFLVIIACINFINLSTAQAVNRSREVGVRKVLGSNRGQLIIRFLGETGVVALLALISAVMVTLAGIPLLNKLLNIHIATTVLYSPKFLLSVAATWGLVTLLSGLYPSIVLSGIGTINVLKGYLGNGRQGISMRRALVVFQFAVAQTLIISMLVVSSQMNYFRNADLGFNNTAIINAPFPRDSLSRTKLERLRNSLLANPFIQQASFSAFSPVSPQGWATDFRLANSISENKIVVAMRPADTSFFQVYGLKLIAGRTYFQADTMREFVINETLVKKLGLKNPESAIGKIVKTGGGTGPIVGVVKDFHINSLRDPISPMVMTTFKNTYGLVNVKVDLSKAKEAIAAMQNIWKSTYPDYVFEYSFVDQALANFYHQENQISILYKVFAALAIFISCLGLLGLVSFMATQRRKEIGVRKVLGAPVHSIVQMLSKEFTLLIILSFIIASPVAWYLMKEWLQQFAYRIPIGFTHFLITILGSILIAWVTVGFTAIKAALANPVKSLRTE